MYDFVFCNQLICNSSVAALVPASKIAGGYDFIGDSSKSIARSHPLTVAFTVTVTFTVILTVLVTSTPSAALAS